MLMDTVLLFLILMLLMFAMFANGLLGVLAGDPNFATLADSLNVMGLLSFGLSAPDSSSVSSRETVESTDSALSRLASVPFRDSESVTLSPDIPSGRTTSSAAEPERLDAEKACNVQF